MENAVAMITPSPVRRVISVSILYILGAIVLYLAITKPPAQIVYQVFLLLIGIGAVILGDKMRRATALSLFMTNDALVDSSGREICRLDDIMGIDRGAFAFKPANGFLLRVNKQLGRSWSPGLWWRMGHRIGVGGATSARQGKFMAEAIAMHLAMAGKD